MRTLRKYRFTSLLAIVAMSTTGLAVSTSVKADDIAPGFSPRFMDPAKHRLFPMVEPTRFPLGWGRSMYGDVQGFPSDMPLLFAIAVTGNTGATLGIRLPNPATDDGRVANMAPSGATPLNVTLTPGLTSWDNATELAFTGTQMAINRALANLFVIVTDKVGDINLKYVVTRDEGAAYNVTNNHFYRFVDWANGASPDFIGGSSRTWTKALADAATYTYKGVQGHLATVTTESENNFVRDRLGQARNVFLAGSDKDREGQWKWHAGPENGQVFWEARCAADNTCNGDVTYIDRTPAINTYSAWAISSTAPDDVNENEPNDWGAGASNDEDYLVTNRFINTRNPQDPRWNDVPISGNFVGGYVVEFSGNVEDYAGVFTREVTLKVAPQVLSFTAKRTSSSTAEVNGIILGYTSPWKVEVQRRTGRGKFQTVKVVTPPVQNFSRFKYVDKLPRGNTLRSFDYRFVVTPTGLSKTLISSSANIPIASKFAQVATKLVFKAGDHVVGFASSVFKGVGLKPRSKFKVTLRSEPVVLIDTTVGSDGNISALVNIPETIEPGKHTVTVEGTSANGKPIKTVASFTLDENLIVTQVADSSNPQGILELDELPATGTQSSMILLVATLIVSMGGAILIFRRRTSEESIY